MERIATWVTTMADATDPVINRLLKAGLDKRQPLEVKLIARHAAVTFVGVAKEDHKIRSSIYSTASLALDPWLEPSVAHSATDDPRHSYASTDSWKQRPRFIDLEWLMAGDTGTSQHPVPGRVPTEFERLSPVLGGLLADLKDTIHAWDIAGRRLDKPLLIVIDEAGQLELGWLPSEVSTIAALGAFFVTCWQNLSQIHHRYGTLADAVLSGHRTKCFFAGVDDLTTTRYLTGLLGSEYVSRTSVSNDVPELFGGGRSGGRRSVSRGEQRVEFAPAEHGPRDEPRRSRPHPRDAAADPPRSGPLVGPDGTRRTRSARRRRPPQTTRTTCPPAHLAPKPPPPKTPTSTKPPSPRPSPSWPTSARRNRTGHAPAAAPAPAR